MRRGRARKLFKTEAELAKVMVSYLEEEGWSVWQEISSGWGGSRADIVAKRPKGDDVELMVVETKLILNFELLEQAESWTWAADKVYICIPGGRRGRHGLITRICRNLIGCGIYQVQDGFADSFHVEEVLRPPDLFDLETQKRFVEKKTHTRSTKEREHLLTCLRPENQYGYAQAGTNRGGYWTPFRETCNRLLEYVGKNPGTTVRDFVENVPTHYSSKQGARSRLPDLIEKGIVGPVRIEREPGFGKSPKMFLVEEKVVSG